MPTSSRHRPSRRRALQQIGLSLVAGAVAQSIAPAQARAETNGVPTRIVPIPGRTPTHTTMESMTPAEWAVVDEGGRAHQAGLPDRILRMLRQLDEVTDGLPVTQLTHALQTATRAYRANATDEVVLCALVHDVGKVISDYNHGQVAANLSVPFLSEPNFWLLLTHQQFQRRYYKPASGPLPQTYQKYEKEPWYGLAMQFSSEWDQTSFDPNYATLPLGHFEPLVRETYRDTLAARTKKPA